MAPNEIKKNSSMQTDAYAFGENNQDEGTSDCG
jgi:hypothetical protein